MQEQNKLGTQTLLTQKVKVDELSAKKYIPLSLSESLRPTPSLKRRKALKPKVFIPHVRKTIS